MVAAITPLNELHHNIHSLGGTHQPLLRFSARHVHTLRCRQSSQLDQPAKLFSNGRHYTTSAVNSVAGRGRLRTAIRAQLQGSLVAEPRSGGARELITWVSELPWARVAIWATVALTASQFQDFFGVSIFFEIICRDRTLPDSINHQFNKAT